jgi:4-hydroxybenzoate polyprenyltransferase
MIKLSHTIFALPFALLASILALLKSNLQKEEIYFKLFLICICMFSARSSAMGFNRYIDSEFDSKNTRTSIREIPSGKISKNEVLGFTILFSFIFIIACYFINPLCFLLSFPTLFIILFYSYTKRFTYLCHFILGLGIGISTSGAWVAILNEISLLPALLSFGLTFHIAGFDILYSIQDREFDKEQGLYSIPSRFSLKVSFYIARISHIIAFSLFIFAGIIGNLGLYYYLFLGITGILFLIEHLLVKENDLSKIPIAFFHINASISVVLFIGILLDKWSLLIEKFYS